MPSSSESKSVSLTTQAEKPIHYTYLKEFRVEQCPLFLQHKCTQHKPFTCFYWHFMNQRRRRPIRRRDGTFNYSPDVYCTKYDETSGICPDGDDCPYLHRTAGDTERRYHLRYYKTGICVYDTDSRGYCVKNGPHCAFAHGLHDLRNPVYDVRELQAMETVEEGPNGNSSGPNNLDKERNAINEDPKWLGNKVQESYINKVVIDTTYVLGYYKTEPCKRPPRLCRQGYACPQYHNNRDRRRSPKKFKYRSTPCPNVKQGDEWGDPTNCESGDNCPYCHTRTEQQFHPEIYKSTKCNDILQNGYCPRGPFCAFAHVDKEISAVRDLGPDNSTDLAAILSSALPATPTQLSPSSTKEGTKKNEPVTNQATDQNSTILNNPPQSQLPASRTDVNREFISNNTNPLPAPIGRPRSYSSSTNHSSESIPHYPKAPGSEREDKEASIQRQLQNIDNDSNLDPLEKARRKQSLYISHNFNPHGSSQPVSLKGMSPLANLFCPASDTVESVVGNALDDLNIDDINVEASLERDLENESHSVNHTSALMGASAPMNIPHTDLHDSCGGSLSNFSPAIASPLGSHMLQLSLGSEQQSIDKALNDISTNDMRSIPTPYFGSSGSYSGNKYGHFPTTSPALYELAPSQNMSPSGSRIFNTSELQRLREEVSSNRTKLVLWEEAMSQAYEAWKRDTDEANRRERLIEQQRDEAVAKLSLLQKELNGGPYLRTLTRVTELENLSLYQIAMLQEQLRGDLDKISQCLELKQNEIFPAGPTYSQIVRRSISSPGEPSQESLKEKQLAYSDMD